MAGILTEAELEPDEIMTEQVCIGESCSRYLYSCPSDAVLHFGIDKRGCSLEAQRAMLCSEDSFNLWQSILRGSGVITGCRPAAHG